MGLSWACSTPTFFGLLVFSARVNGVTAAPFLIVTMLIAGDRQVMGKHRNGKTASVLGCPTAVIMSAVAVIGIWLTFDGRFGLSTCDE